MVRKPFTRCLLLPCCCYHSDLCKSSPSTCIQITECVVDIKYHCSSNKAWDTDSSLPIPHHKCMVMCGQAFRLRESALLCKTKQIVGRRSSGMESFTPQDRWKLKMFLQFVSISNHSYFIVNLIRKSLSEALA